ncbi:DUF3131 domain-containing protein [Membranicola marinus]|uniref:DUF3131 domain-containing protein n=1 Tax=Membranihabitans marinus TaxID=1227546 RepID=A0A953HXW4_9BACT|nr:glucoamylase family protein [Membranihabitans marinus]MBY5958666.1 DUF3131 domain-containing protein [Membranihabitans marinus]
MRTKKKIRPQRRRKIWLLVFLFAGTFISCKKEDVPVPEPPALTIQYARLGAESILHGSTVAPYGNIVVGFSKPVVAESEEYFRVLEESRPIETNVSWSTNRTEVTLTNPDSWKEGEKYSVILSPAISAEDGGTFAGDTLTFSIIVGELMLTLRTRNGDVLDRGIRNAGIALLPALDLILSHPVPESVMQNNISWSGSGPAALILTATSDTSYLLTTDHPLPYYTSYTLTFSGDLAEDTGRPFVPVTYELFTKLDSTYKFQELTDEALLTLIQKHTFKYFWEGAEPNSGMARERNSSANTVTTGGTGFGLMAMIVAVERGFITREEAVKRWQKIFNFLASADRFHGAWPHWLNGETGKVRPFSQKDNGADLVETALLTQGVLTVRQYLDPDLSKERALIDQINMLWRNIEWDWFTKSDDNVLFWHWSPDYEWEINLPIRGHNETQIVYVLAASSPTHTIDKSVYDEGYARSGGMKNGNTYYGYPLPLGPEKGGPLFFAHYSYVGMDPRNLKDQYADYWGQNKNHTFINQAYCIENPKHFIGYSADCWGLTASDEKGGYSAHSPTNDRGVITPTAALSSFPYTPEESMQALRHFYYLLGDRLWGDYGFYDAFNIGEEWVADSYLAIDQGPIICMIENYRTGLLWELFMSAPEIQNGLEKLNFTYE